MSDKLDLGCAALKRAWDEFERAAPTLSDKPRALELADWLDADACDLQTPRQAAAELRKKHGQVRELREALEEIQRRVMNGASFRLGLAVATIAQTALTNTKD